MPSDRRLRLRFHGRVIDHLGIDMYQSPVAAVAEIISNAWDADAESVSITSQTRAKRPAKDRRGKTEGATRNVAVYFGSDALKVAVDCRQKFCRSKAGGI